MVPLYGLPLEDHDRKDGEDGDGEHLLNDFQLHQRKRAAVLNEANAVAVHLADIFRQSQQPRREDDDEQRGVIRDGANGLQFQMAIPGQRHEAVADDEQRDGVESVHSFSVRCRESDDTKDFFLRLSRLFSRLKVLVTI